jgi:hypothetical protein
MLPFKESGAWYFHNLCSLIALFFQSDSDTIDQACTFFNGISDQRRQPA